MELTEDDIPESVLLYLFREDFLFCFTESYIVSVSLDDLVPVPLTYPVSEVVPEHSTECCERDREYDV